MTVCCDGVPIHAIEPCQLLDSIEWKASLIESKHININELDIKDGPKHEVSLVADEDSMYVELNRQKLEDIRQMKENATSRTKNSKKKHPYLWHIIDSIVCKDISQKMYHMNEAFQKTYNINTMKDAKYQCRKNPLFRSLSVDVLNTASHGKLITDNWLNSQGRSLPLMCLHNPTTGLPNSNYDLSRQKVPICTKNDAEVMNYEKIIPWRNSDVAYMLVHSNPKLKISFGNNEQFASETGLNGERIILPSLKMQIRMIDVKSCKFVPSQLQEKWKLDNALKHCGFCNFCKPVPEGEGSGVHPSLQ